MLAAIEQVATPSQKSAVSRLFLSHTAGMHLVTPNAKMSNAVVPTQARITAFVLFAD